MTDEVKVYEADLSEFTPDERNANKGTERGAYMLDASLTEVGAGRSIVVDQNGKVPAGNKTLEAAVEAGFEGAIVVESDGKRLVVVKRTDWDLADEDPNNPARRYAVWDNRTSEVSLEWDADVIQMDMDAGLDFGKMFKGLELDAVLATGIEVYGEGATEGRRETNNMDCMRNKEFGKGPYIRCEIGEVMTSIPRELYERVWTIVSGAESQQDGIVGVLTLAVNNWDS